MCVRTHRHTHTHTNIFKAKSQCCFGFLGMPSIISHLVCVLCVYTQEGNLSHWSDVSNTTDYSEPWWKIFFLTPPPPVCVSIFVCTCVCVHKLAFICVGVSALNILWHSVGSERNHQLRQKGNQLTYAGIHVFKNELWKEYTWGKSQEDKHKVNTCADTHAGRGSAKWSRGVTYGRVRRSYIRMEEIQQWKC